MSDNINFFNQVDALWIQPEINKRKSNNQLPENFLIYQCLIKFPKDNEPIVEFNNEIKWTAKIKLDTDSAINKGDKIYLYNVKDIVLVEPPIYKNNRVGFIYLYYTGQSYNFIFDFTPNIPENLISNEKKNEWLFSEEIAKSIKKNWIMGCAIIVTISFK